MKHAKFSASASPKWTNCSASVHLEEKMPPNDTFFSKEGNLAHDVAYKLATSSIPEDEIIYISEEILDSAKQYISYIGNIVSVESEILIYFERKVFYGELIGLDNNLAFGTADCIIYNPTEKHLHIIDFKYGKGVKVEAQKNTQLLLYGIGAYQELRHTKEISKITLHIAQPRIDNFNTYSLDLKELTDFWIPFFKEKIIEVTSNPTLNPSNSTCKFCKAKPICPALYEKTMNIKDSINTKQNFDLINEVQIKNLLSNSDLIIDYLNSLKDYVYSQTLQNGIFAGYKLIKGKSVRKIKEDLIADLEKEIGVNLHKKTPLGVIEIEKILKSFNKDIQDFVQVTEQKPVLVEETDKRPSII